MTWSSGMKLPCAMDGVKEGFREKVAFELRHKAHVGGGALWGL